MRYHIFVCRTIATVSRLNIPESVKLFPLKIYSWFSAEILEDYRVSIPEALEFAVVRSAIDR